MESQGSKHHMKETLMFMLPLVISKNMLGGRRRQNPFGSNSLTFSFLDNLMKNMPGNDNISGSGCWTN
jgi:hypothetical protein